MWFICRLWMHRSIRISGLSHSVERPRCDFDRSCGSLRVTHVVLSLDSGGLERIVLELIRGGVSGGHEISVICLERPGTLAQDARDAGATLNCLNKLPGIRPRIAQGISQVLRRHRPHVVHTHQVGALAYAGPAAYWSGVPAVVHTEHGKHYSSRWKTKMLGRVASRFAQKICCVSEDILHEVIREGVAPAAKCAFVPNGIDTSRFFRVHDSVAARRTRAGVPAAALVVGTVGRLTEVKRQSSLIRSFAALLSQLPTIPFHLLIVGDGPEGANLENLTDELGIRNRVTFSGYQPQPEYYLGLMDIFALTSRSEGMPLAVLEAWAAGIPVVATRVGGLPRLIKHGTTGLLVELDNIPELTSCLGQLALNRDLACRLGTAGKQVVSEQYDVQMMWDRYQAIYQQLMSANPTTSCAS